jgi:putative tricarboxylic transport membrane protein
MAVFMSILVLHGMQPGPLMLLKNREEIYSLVWALTAACLIASLIGLLLARPLAGLTRVDVHILAPLIIALSFAGSFAIDLELGNLIVTAAFGVLGYLMIVLNYPRLPLVIGIVLGGVAERTFLQSMMISDGDISIFVNRTTCQILLAGMAAAFLWPRLMKRLGGRRQDVGLTPSKTLGDRR